MPERQLYTIAQVVYAPSPTKSALRHAIARRQLPVARRPGRVYVTRAGIEQFMPGHAGKQS